jgi:hypothetical protein
MRFYAPRFSLKLLSYHFFNGGLRILLLRVRVRLPSHTVLKVDLGNLVSNLTASQKRQHNKQPCPYNTKELPVCGPTCLYVAYITLFSQQLLSKGKKTCSYFCNIIGGHITQCICFSSAVWTLGELTPPDSYHGKITKFLKICF